VKKISIVLAIDRSFELRDFDRYGVVTLSKFFNVHILDFSYIVNPKLHERNQNVLIEKFSYDQCSAIKEFKSLYNFLEQDHISFYIDLMGTSFSCNKIRRIISVHKVERIKLFLGELPQLNSSESIKSRLKKVAKRGRFFYRIFEYSIKKIVLQKLEPKIDISVYSGSVCSERYDNQNNIIWTHAFDYQAYLNLLRSQSEFKNEKRFAVFLDQNAPSHPDYHFHKNKPPVSEKSYYQSMNYFFDNFEKITGVEIIIASHPRLSTIKSKNQWGSRRSIIGETPLLVKESNLVFAHYSTAISFAVLMRKPILQLLTNDYIGSYRYDRFIAFGNALNLIQLNVDNFDKNNIAKQDFFSFDKDLYKNYEEQYLKSRFSSLNDLWVEVAEKINKYKGLKNEV
jgi:hypothetical protein